MISAASFDRDVERLATPIENPAEALVDASLVAEVRALLALTDSVERHRAGDLRIVVPNDDYVGDHKEYVLRPFAHPGESRFSDGSFGVLYAGLSTPTAIEESVYWLTRFYTDSAMPDGTVAPKQHLTMRACASVADVRESVAGISSIYDPSDYTVSRKYGAELRPKHDGLWYGSVRNKGGECVGLFVPRVLSNVRMRSRYEFLWDGTRFSTVKQIHLRSN